MRWNNATKQILMSYRGLALATHTLPAATHKLINGIKICYAYYEQLLHVWWHTVKIILPQPARKLIAHSPIHCLGFILLVHFARGAWALLFDDNDFFLSYFRPFCSIFFVLLCCSRWAEIAEYLSESVTFSCTFGFSEWFSYGSIESNRIASIGMEWNGMESIWVSMTSMRIKPCKWLLLYSRFSSLLRQAHPIYIGGGGGESEMEWELVTIAFHIDTTTTWMQDIHSGSFSPDKSISLKNIPFHYHFWEISSLGDHFRLFFSKTFVGHVCDGFVVKLITTWWCQGTTCHILLWCFA